MWKSFNVLHHFPKVLVRKTLCCSIFEEAHVREDSTILRSSDAFQKHLLLEPDSPPNSRIVNVAVIGAPNAGKSTLINKLMGHKISSVSSKVHTTRRLTSSVFLNEETQVVFLDTPGMISHAKRRGHRLEKSLHVDPYYSLALADLVLVLVDAGDPWRRLRLSPEVLRALHMYPNHNSALVLNKVDRLRSKDFLLDLVHPLTEGVVGGSAVPVFSRGKRKKRERKVQAQSENHDEEGDELEVAEELEVDREKMRAINKEIKGKEGWDQFQEVFMVSALKDDGIDELRSFVLRCSRRGAWRFHSSVMTDQGPQELLELCVREQLLENLPNEVPYVIDITVAVWQNTDEGADIFVYLDCPTQRAMTVTIGKGGKTIQKMTEAARQELSRTFGCNVALKLILRLRE